MRTPDTALKTVLERVFAEMYGSRSKDFASRRDDFVFHMTDWQEDFRRLSELYDNPTRFSAAEAESVVQAFLYHAPGHLAAAARLYGAFLDPFYESTEGLVAPQKRRSKQKRAQPQRKRKAKAPKTKKGRSA